MLPGKTCAIAAEMSKLKQTIQVTSTHSFICEFTNEFHDGTKAAYIAEFHDIQLAVHQEPETECLNNYISLFSTKILILDNRIGLPWFSAFVL